MNLCRSLALRHAALGFVLVIPAPLFADLVAFPGADGAGAAVTGGRGGIVYHVTKLDESYSDSGPGTLRYGVTDANFKDADGSIMPRTIVFDVGGTIWLGRFNTQANGWDTQSSLTVGSNVTIAGQTAPGGIIIAGGQLKMNGTGGTTPNSNSILRNVSILPGYGIRSVNSTSGYHDSYTYDAIDVNSANVIIDHVSANFATDETISANELAKNVTVQYTSMSQGQNYPQADPEVKINGVGTYAGHALGSLWSPGSDAKTSLLHNLYAHMSGRAPTVQTESSKLTNNVPPQTDIRNNVIYNWFGTAGYGSAGEPSAANFVGNVYKVGPGGDNVPRATTPSIVQAAGSTNPFGPSASTTIYSSGNVRFNLDGSTTTLGTGSFSAPAQTLASPLAVPYLGITENAADAYARVLNYVGSNWNSRTAIDARIINEVRTGTGKITALDDSQNGYNSAGVYVTNGIDTEWGNMLNLRGGTAGVGGKGAFVRPANFDTDGDGMPDIWETAHALDPSTASNNGDYDNNGYTNLEEYLNELAAFPAPTPLQFNNANGNGRFAQIGNWQAGTSASTTGTWQPSRYDQADILSGNATIDSVGQHARVVDVGGNIATPAALTVTAGWIDVADSINVNTGGSVLQTDGLVRAAKQITINAASTYMLRGGVMATSILSNGTGGTFVMTGGTLHADRVTFSFTNSGGTIAPGGELALQLLAAAGYADIDGDAPTAESLVGQTQVNGDLTLASGSLQVDLASGSNFDRLLVDGSLALGGSLDVNVLSGYTPSVGDRWLFATAGSIDGLFLTVTNGFAVQQTGGDLYLVAVPEPTATVFLAGAGAFLVRKRRQRNTTR